MSSRSSCHISIFQKHQHHQCASLTGAWAQMAQMQVQVLPLAQAQVLALAQVLAQ
jgi:hypothetical protein